MQAKKRYILVIICCAFLAYCYFGGYRLKWLQKLFAISVRRNPSKLPPYHQLHYQFPDDPTTKPTSAVVPDDDLFAHPPYESKYIGDERTGRTDV